MLRLTFPSCDLIIDHRSALAPIDALDCLDSEDEVRRLLLIALTTPSALDSLRRFFARWNSEAWRVNVITDRILIERVARMTVDGPLAAFVVHNRPTLNTNDIAAKLAAADISRGMRTPGPPVEVGHKAVAPPTATAAPAPAAPASLSALAAAAAAKLNFVLMTREQRFDQVLCRALPHVPSVLSGAYKRLLNSDMRITTIGVLTVWGGARDLGIGFIVDSLLSIGRLASREADLIDAAETLHEVTECTLEARDERDLEYAAELFADVVATCGVGTFIAVIAHGATRLVSSAAKGLPNRSPGGRNPGQSSR